MNSQAFESTRQLEFLTELVNSHGAVAGDILQIGTATWAIHGLVPMDGHVLLAEYDSLESAQAALAQLPPNWPAEHDQPVGVAPAYSLGRPSEAWRAVLQPRLRPAAA